MACRTSRRLFPFGEVVMVRVPIDPPGLRKKLDGQWLKGVWVGRMDENDGNIVLTPQGTVWQVSEEAEPGVEVPAGRREDDQE